METKTTKYKVEVKTIGDPKWYSNAIRYDIKEAAEIAGDRLACNWSAVEEYRVVEAE